jgi:hypothetical protein
VRSHTIMVVTADGRMGTFGHGTMADWGMEPDDTEQKLIKTLVQVLSVRFGGAKIV